MYHHNFAENLCRICKEKHISVEMLAEAIGKSPRQINRYRNEQCRDIPLSVVEEIASFLEVSPAELLS